LLDALRPAGYVVYEYVVIVGITGFVGAIAVRTVVALVRGQLILAPPAQPATPPATDQPERNQHV
jgi:tellurite resistance protein